MNDGKAARIASVGGREMTYSDCFTNEQLHHALAKAVAERDEARDMVLRLRKQRAIARNFGEQMERERDEAREALDRIARPVWWMQEDQKRKTGSINGISGGMALALSEDAEYLKGIARSALRGEAK